MKLSFLNFWGDFDPNNNFFIHLLKSYKENVQVVSPERADNIIYTCFGQEHLNYNNCNKIFYTGENIRPNFGECNGALSFDIDDHGGKNVRLPLWMLYIDWFNVGSYGNPNGLVPISKINNNRFKNRLKTKTCCIVVNHLGNNRNIIMNKLQQHFSVDGKGKPFNNWDYGEDLKYNFISDYKFNICFENTIYPGYHTEKLFHAKIAGCIPLYNGSTTIDSDFNPKCFLNLQDFSNIENFISKILEINSSDRLYKEIYEQPLFNTEPSLEDTFNKVNKLFL